MITSRPSSTTLSKGFTALLDSLSLVDLDTDIMVAGRNLQQPSGRVFGGQVLAQALLAAGRSLDPARVPHSMHAYFLRPGRVDLPITLAVERLRDGRSFSARRIRAIQGGEPILAATASFQLQEGGLDHGATMPSAPPPESLPRMEETLASAEPAYRHFWATDNAFDIRHVDGSVHLGAAKDRARRQLVWVRARETFDAGEIVHRALLAFVCDQVMLHPVLRRHGESLASPGLSIASIDHAMWWYANIDITQWHLMAQESPAARSGRGLGFLNVFRADGTLVAAGAQEGMIRLPAITC